MSTLQQWLLLLRVHWRMLRVRTASAASRSRLMTFTISSFLLGYLVASYWLFREGLAYVYRLPAAGALLGDRIIYLLFFCFFLMLLFSVAVTVYISLYRSRDTRWLLTLPVSHRALFLWKCTEAAAFSSWGLAFILAPLLVAYATTRDVSIVYFIKAAILILLFLILTGALGSLLLITATRWLNRRQIAVGLAATALFLIGTTVRTAFEDKKLVESSGLGAAMTFQRVLHHTSAAVNRGMPSAWTAGTLVDWTRTFRRPGHLLYPTLLLSHSLFAVLLLTMVGERWFYPSWNRSLQHSARQALLRERKKSGANAPMPAGSRPTLLSRLIGRPLAAVSRKDFLTFVREPAQWVQFSVVFGLLALYSTGLRRINGDLSQARDLYLVAFLNLSVCALALSTLTTRFVFPQFSLEGRRLWILAMSPLPLPSIVTQKFVISTLCSGLVIIGILLIGGYSLQLGFADTLFFAVAVGLLALGLNGLAVGLGVLFPNLREANAAKIVSSFGGTLCLVGSFLYILTFVLILAFLRWEIFKTNSIVPDWYRDPSRQAGLCGLLLLTALVTGVPLIFSRKKLKRLEILINS